MHAFGAELVGAMIELFVFMLQAAGKCELLTVVHGFYFEKIFN